MAQVGSWGPFVFDVSASRIFTIANGATRKSSSNWATHDRVEGKPRTQYQGAGLRGVNVTIKLRADYGVPPAKTLEQLHNAAEGRNVYPLIIGGVPQAQNPMRLTGCNETKDLSLGDGALYSATAALTFEEYN